MRFGRGKYQTELWWDGLRIGAEEELVVEVAPNGDTETRRGRLRIYVYPSVDALVPSGFVDYASRDAAPESGSVYQVLTDPTGLPLCIEDARGETVWWASATDPYGDIEVHPSSRIDYAMRWAGHRLDAALGLFYNRFRDYDPTLARYLQTDPIGQRGGLNVYAYCSNPLKHVDLLGLAASAPHANGANNPVPGGETGDATATPHTEEAPDPEGTFRDSQNRLRDLETGRYVTDPRATGDYTPDVVATKERDRRMDGAALDPADPAVRGHLADRDAALAERDRLLAAGNERGAAQAQARANKATEHLGNMAADAAVRRAYPHARMPPLHSGEGPGTFDRVYENGNPPPSHIIAEGKGGSASNSSSRMGADGRRHQQGTPGYRDSVVEAMSRSRDPAARATADVLGRSIPAYVEVHQPITTSPHPTTGRPRSSLGAIHGSTYGDGSDRLP